MLRGVLLSNDTSKIPNFLFTKNEKEIIKGI